MIGCVDAYLAGDDVTRRSRTGFVIYLNQAPIYWFSKRQNRVECSTFGSEFVAMKQCCEYVRGADVQAKDDGDSSYRMFVFIW